MGCVRCRVKAASGGWSYGHAYVMITCEGLWHHLISNTSRAGFAWLSYFDIDCCLLGKAHSQLSLWSTSRRKRTPSLRWPLTTKNSTNNYIFSESFQVAETSCWLEKSIVYLHHHCSWQIVQWRQQKCAKCFTPGSSTTWVQFTESTHSYWLNFLLLKITLGMASFWWHWSSSHD